MFFSSRWFIVSLTLLSWMVFHYWVLVYWYSISPYLSLWDSILSTALVGGLSMGLSNGFISYYIPSQNKFLIGTIASCCIALIGLWLTYQGLRQIGQDDDAYLSFLQQSQPVRYAVNFLIIAGVTMSTIFYQRMKEQEEASSREAATSSMIREAELQKLQLQLQPHFLFNSLNSINALILARPDEARKMVLNLSDFLRTTIKRADEHWITLADEWNYLQLYLEIEKVRFGHRLDVETNFQPGSFEWKIPTLLLQPIVENAIKFGLYGTTGKVTIKLDGVVTEGLLQLNISNPFDEESQPPKGSGFGLNGIKRRLYLLYARNDLLETVVNENLFKVKLKIPKVA
ncbi:MAG TPA: histidine kinase [Cyclobacteriaceae bacterium]|nr:histidine kinase [Cyclobacteriaceae bacterium]